jgi:hypothetical protein
MPPSFLLILLLTSLAAASSLTTLLDTRAYHRGAAMPVTRVLDAGVPTALIAAVDVQVPTGASCNSLVVDLGLERAYGATATNYRTPGNTSFFLWRHPLAGAFRTTAPALVWQGNVSQPGSGTCWSLATPTSCNLVNVPGSHYELGTRRFVLPLMASALVGGAVNGTTYWLGVTVATERATSAVDGSYNQVRWMATTMARVGLPYQVVDAYGTAYPNLNLTNWTTASVAEPSLLVGTLSSSGTQELAIGVWAWCTGVAAGDPRLVTSLPRPYTDVIPSPSPLRAPSPLVVQPSPDATPVPSGGEDSSPVPSGEEGSPAPLGVEGSPVPVDSPSSPGQVVIIDVEPTSIVVEASTPSPSRILGGTTSVPTPALTPPPSPVLGQGTPPPRAPSPTLGGQGTPSVTPTRPTPLPVPVVQVADVPTPIRLDTATPPDPPIAVVETPPSSMLSSTTTLVLGVLGGVIALALVLALLYLLMERRRRHLLTLSTVQLKDFGTENDKLYSGSKSSASASNSSDDNTSDVKKKNKGPATYKPVATLLEEATSEGKAAAAYEDNVQRTVVLDD